MKNLISIVIPTYNSADTIIETLDSIKEQTYPNIELVITDDDSTDGTIACVKRWLMKNRKRFVNVKLLRAKKNGGVVINCNRGIRSSSGIYIKLIAADDILLPRCLELNEQRLLETGSAIVFSKVQVFGNRKLVSEMERNMKKAYKVLMSAEDQKIKEFFLKNVFMPSPGLFFSRELYNNIGGFDIRFPFWEDGPFYMKVLSKGYHIEFIDEFTVRYRMNDESLGHAVGHERLSHVAYMLLKSQIKYYYLLHTKELLMNKMYKECIALQKKQLERVDKLCTYYRNECKERV